MDMEVEMRDGGEDERWRGGREVEMEVRDGGEGKRWRVEREVKMGDGDER